METDWGIRLLLVITFLYILWNSFLVQRIDRRVEWLSRRIDRMRD